MYSVTWAIYLLYVGVVRCSHVDKKCYQACVNVHLFKQQPAFEGQCCDSNANFKSKLTYIKHVPSFKGISTLSPDLTVLKTVLTIDLTLLDMSIL